MLEGDAFRSRLSGADFFCRRRGDLLTNFACRGHRLEGGVHDVRRARSTRVVGRLGLKQLGVRKDDTELIAQTVEQLAQFDRLGHRTALGGGRHSTLEPACILRRLLVLM